MKPDKTASVLAFERKLCNSDGLMYAGSWGDFSNHQTWKPIALQEKDVRGTVSNRRSSKNANDPMKLDAEIQNPNLQCVDIAALPFDADTLKVVFTLRILGNVSTPSCCNEPTYQESLQQAITQYIKDHGCGELAQRYAINLANGRFLWRNRIGAEQVKVQVSVIINGCVDKAWTFDSHKFNLNRFDDSDSKIKELAEVIQQGLLGNTYTLLKIEAFARLGMGQEVFPSQELVKDERNEKNKKSKFLYAVDDVAALHSQKIGNAIRTIDTWHPKASEIGPIAVEPYGSVTSRGVAYRQPRDKTDFYSLLDNWILKDKIPLLEQQHFVVACLIRGGVFGEKEDKNKEKKNEV
jgi:CRISPR-associated protein Csy3